MARGDKEYFRVEVAFVGSPEFVRMSGEARKVYDVLMARCIQTRRTVLYGLDHRWLAGASGLTWQRVPSALAELGRCLCGKDKLPLVSVQPEGNLFTIKVEGMDRNNPKFKWSDSPFNPQSKSFTPLKNGAERSGTERNGELSPPASKPKRTDPKNKKPKPETNPNIKTFIDWYFDEHLARFGTKLLVNGGQDAATVKRMLGSLGIDDLKVRAERFLADPKSWPQGDKSIKFLAENINRYKDEKCDGGREDVDYDALGAPPKRRETDAM